MIESSIDFENSFIQKFGDLDRTSLGSIVENKLRFELGGEGTDSARITQAIKRSNQILQYCFDESPIWLRIILWSDEEEVNLKNAGLIVHNADKVFRNKGDEEILYLYFKKYLSFQVSPIITSIINYDMAEEPSANITCYFVDLEKLILVNIYDDRGMDVYALNQEFIKDLSSKFQSWMI
jgi:hypothetical protein